MKQLGESIEKAVRGTIVHARYCTLRLLPERFLEPLLAVVFDDLFLAHPCDAGVLAGVATRAALA